MSNPVNEGARQRLLEHGLYEVLGGDAQEANDLAPLVRAAWERGERVDPGPSPRSEPTRDTSSPRWIPWAAAAGLAALAGGAWWASAQRPDDPVPGNMPELEMASGPQEPESTAPVIHPNALAQAELLSQKLDDLYVKGMPPEIAREVIEGSYREGALSALRRTPEIWPHVDDVFDGLLDPEEQPLNVRRELIRALAVDESAVVLRRLRSEWLKQPEAFTIDVVITLAERGAFEFEREAEAWLASYRVGESASDPADGLSGDPLTAAVHGAFRGDARAVPVLEVELESKASGERSLLAAVGLARLGRGTAWIDRFEGYVDSIRAALDAPDLSSGDLEDLASQIDALSYALALHDGTRLDAFEATPEWDGTPRVGDLAHWLGLYRQARARDVRDRDVLESELESLLDR
ncbi:MAG: hypothetical protein AAGG01_08335 [Planctomycetota bacterium]